MGYSHEQDRKGHNSWRRYILEGLGVDGQETNEEILVNEKYYDNNKIIRYKALGG